MEKIDSKNLNGLSAQSALKSSEEKNKIFENPIVPKWVSTKVAASWNHSKCSSNSKVQRRN